MHLYSESFCGEKRWLRNSSCNNSLEQKWKKNVQNIFILFYSCGIYVQLQLNKFMALSGSVILLKEDKRRVTAV